MEKKDFILASNRLVAAVDFIKWTSTFGEGSIRQMEVPVSGVRLAPGLSRLFGISRDEAGIMLVMHEREGAWLAHLPIACAFIGYGDELLVITERFHLFDVPFERIGVGVFVPSPDMRAEMAEKALIGFGLIRDRQGRDVIERVNRIVPLFTPERYEEAKRGAKSQDGGTNLFSAS